MRAEEKLRIPSRRSTMILAHRHSGAVSFSKRQTRERISIALIG